MVKRARLGYFGLVFSPFGPVWPVGPNTGETYVLPKANPGHPGWWSKGHFGASSGPFLTPFAPPIAWLVPWFGLFSSQKRVEMAATKPG